MHENNTSNLDTANDARNDAADLQPPEKCPTVLSSPPQKRRNTYSPPRRGGVPARRNDGVVPFHFHIID
ncbi:hypothetical protein [Chryseobacterium koreense]|uniref:hypothetical protein n=1 Tax=Chryseobacterium koreense TaxID=232216 RepID=UPI0026EC2FB1|nr:hypothetical protein [Chryseobacterium koreense]